MTSFESAVAKVRALATLPEGWDYGRGGPVGESATAGAISVLHALMDGGLDRFDAVPASNEGVTVFGLVLGAEIEVICDATGAPYLFAKSPDGVEIEREDLSYASAVSCIRGLDWLPKRSFIWCIQNVTLTRRDALAVMPSPIHAMEAAFQLSAQNAQNRTVARSVNISGNMQSEDLGRYRQSFGVLKPKLALT